MKIIEELCEMIEEELDDAEKYVRCAMAKRAEHPALAEVFYKLSEEEMKHMAMLHEQVTTLIEDHRKKNGAPPEPMMAVYDYLHKKQIDHASKVKAMQVLYKTPNAV